MKISSLSGNTYVVLMDNEFAGWFNIPTGNEETHILRAALSSNPKIVDIEDLSLDIDDLPPAGKGYFWDGTSFKKEDSNGN